MNQARVDQVKLLLEKTPDDTFLLYALAMEYSKDGRVDDAIATFDRLIQVDPTYTAAYVNKARTLADAGRHDHAVTAFEAAREAADAANEHHTCDKIDEELKRLRQ